MKYSDYLILALLIYVDVLFGVTSKTIANNNSPETENGTYYDVCVTVKFLSNSSFTKSCIHEPIPINGRNLEVIIKPETTLCLSLYDLGLKWCSKSSQNFNLPLIANAAQFDSYVSKYDEANVNSFCTTRKNSTSANQTYLYSFYNDMLTCLRNCLDPSAGNMKFKQLCYALAWLETTLNSPGKIFQSQTVAPEPKPGRGNNTPVKAVEVQSTEKQNTESKTEKKPVVNKSETSSTKQVAPESVIKQAVDSGSNTAEKSEEQLSESPMNSEKVLKNQPIPDVKNISQNEQISSKVDKTSVPDTKNPNQKPKHMETVSEIENTEVKPEVNQSPEASVTKVDKKTDSSTGNPGKGKKTEENKSSTLSDNTNDIIDNSELPHEEGDSPLNNNEQDQAGDNGPLNQEQDTFVGRKKISHYLATEAEEESHLFSYFVVFSLLFVCCYIGYHNKKKILAMVLEGRRSRNGRGRRRPSTANYRKLDCNLEEAVTSQCNSNVTHVIY